MHAREEKQALRAVKRKLIQNMDMLELSLPNNSRCNVKDFSLFDIIPIITYIYSYTLTMIPHMKESNLPNSSPNPLRE